MATEAQINANRANAQHSTGPLSPATKLISSHNAVKTGLTGRTILLPNDDVAAYEKLVALMFEKHSPVGDVEEHIVHYIADTEWRLLRIPTLESGVYSLAYTELAGANPPALSDQLANAALNALIARTCEKELRNLLLQERRLQRQLERHVAELKQLQDDREAVNFHRRNLEMNKAAEKIADYQPPANCAEKFGFEFSKDYLETRLTAFKLAGLPAVKSFDRAWQAEFAPSSPTQRNRDRQGAAS